MSLVDQNLLSILKNPENAKIYPIIDKIPWALKNIESVKSHWSGKKSEFLGYHKTCAEKIESEIKTESPSPLTRERLEVLKNAHETNHFNLAKILDSLELGAAAPYDLGTPSHQSLQLYRKNIFRDWGWTTEENKRSLDLITELVGVNWTPIRFCVLGAGAGRLAMDMHKEFRLPMTVAVDFNPLLLAIARRMLDQETISLYDFKTAPVEMNSAVKAYDLKSNLGPLSGFNLLCADVTELPFKPHQFQSVLTPWLIDILPFNFKLLAQRVNEILEVDGTWLNFGPLGFSHQKESWNLTQEEIKEQLGECGFEVESEIVSAMKYLSAEDEVNSRNETVYLFKAKKVRDVKVESFSYLPKWLSETSQSVPLSKEILQHRQIVRLHADLFHTIDGKLSIDQLGAMFATHYKVPVDVAKAMVSNVLRQFEESVKQK